MSATRAMFMANISIGNQCKVDEEQEQPLLYYLNAVIEMRDCGIQFTYKLF